ncbi:MAG: PQQ-like beta-propeller repeat protein [Phycisphaerales bacterium]|nr:MAG: PQQ-like beta-propeller repeat protein [Phycisphaerales bacterium]
MRREIRSCFGMIMTSALVCAATVSERAEAQWPQWGGPNRNFTIETTGLADSWSDEGPRRLWERELGAGYSAIVCDDGALYTMYRKKPTDEVEYTIALDARSGATLWQHENRAKLLAPPDQRWGGQGPNATPLVVGDRLFTVGSRAVLHCFDKKSGRVLWEHDLVRKCGAVLTNSVGYCSSPIAYDKTVIVTVDSLSGENVPDLERNAVPKLEASAGSPGHSIVAFDQISGEIRWKGVRVDTTFSSPIVVNVGGNDQLVSSTYGGVLGVDPKSGALLWQHPMRGGTVTPVWNGEDLVFHSSDGERTLGIVVKLAGEGGTTSIEELWQSKKLRISQATPVRVGDVLVGANDTLLMGVDYRTGRRLWGKRGFANASCVYGDGKLIILDENGRLTLATASRDGLGIHSQCQVTERYSFSVPTLAGTHLYVRDRKNIVALELGAENKGRGTRG